jgi:hypothetical protein
LRKDEKEMERRREKEGRRGDSEHAVVLLRRR